MQNYGQNGADSRIPGHVLWKGIEEETKAAKRLSGPFETIQREVDQLQDVSTRLEGLAEQHPPMSHALVTSLMGTGRGSRHRAPA